MPLIELKTIKPVCDICGKVGSFWTNVEAGDEDNAIPPGWKYGLEAIRLYLTPRVAHRPREGAQRYLVCDECQPEPKPWPENDSQH